MTNTLFGIAALFIVVFLVLFFWLVGRHPDQRAILVAAPQGKRGNLLLAPVVLATVFAPMPFKAVATAILLSGLIGITWAHHTAMARAGANAGFMRRLSAVSAIGLLGLTAFAAAMLLGGSEQFIQAEAASWLGLIQASELA